MLDDRDPQGVGEVAVDRDIGDVGQRRERRADVGGCDGEEVVPGEVVPQKALDAHMAKAADELAKRRVQDEVDALLECGATGIIVKPFDPVTLPQNIRIYWEHGRGKSA